MSNIPIIVVAPRTKTPSIRTQSFVLEQDNWNDHSFQTQYHLSYYVTKSDGGTETTHIGAVKILRLGQTKADGLLITSDFVALDEEFCSIGQSLDYYERLRELGEIGKQAMDALRDVVFLPQLVDKFQGEEGWRVSLFRDQQDIGERFRLIATGLVNGDYAKPPADQQSFIFTPYGWQTSVNVDTRSGEPNSWSIRNNCLPERLNVLVGRNGSGKSTLLARMARVAFGSPSERSETPLNKLGKLEPDGIGFPRVITVAFSPFDSFKLPGSDDRNRVQIVKDIQRGVGRFSFIGLRDFAAEIDLVNHEQKSPKLGTPKSADDRELQTKLKSIVQLTDEFANYLKKISEKKRTPILDLALHILERGLLNNEWTSVSRLDSEEAVRAWFHQCSTGHKIALLVIFGLIANLEPHSLVLIDEPETHLHPPLLAAMMHALRFILEEYEASAIVATHSPVVVQESMARHVHVVRREGDISTVAPVTTETFGESIGLITAQIFGMESNATDFHQVLDTLVTKYGDIEKIEALFKDGVMSFQARAYILGRLTKSEKN